MDRVLSNGHFTRKAREKQKLLADNALYCCDQALFWAHRHTFSTGVCYNLN
jgi:hypothetical protein